MDIPASLWNTGRQYKKHDIVEVGNLALPGNEYRDKNGDVVQPITTHDYLQLQTDQEYVISSDVLAEVDVINSQEITIGTYFGINNDLNYSIGCMVKKLTESSSTIDDQKTYITQSSEGIVDLQNSIGIGIGVKFLDSLGRRIKVSNLRSNHRLMAGSELNDREYYNVLLDIEASSIPDGAVGAYLFVFVYGIKSGGFMFKKPFASNLGRFFYCIEDHASALGKEPNGELGSKYWTQDFIWRPSYGSKSDFVAINDELKMGEGKDYVTSMAINSLPMELTLNFNNRTDAEAKAIVHFLQEKSFAYNSIFSLDYKGNRLLSSDVASFNFKYSYPYKDDLKYTCTEFDHSIVYRNKNNIKAKFVCNTESTLASFESHAGYNKRVDALIPIFIDEVTHFKKGEQISLNTFTLDEGNGAKKIEPSNIFKVKRYDEPGESIKGLIIFREPEKFEEGDCVFVKVKDPENSIYNVGKTKIYKKISETEFVFHPLLEEGSYEDVVNLRATSSAGENTSVQWFDEDSGNQLKIREEKLETVDLADQVWRPTDTNTITPRETTLGQDYGAQYFEENALGQITTRDQNFVVFENASIVRMPVCPEECADTKVLMPEEASIIPATSEDPVTGEIKKRQVYLKNYRRLQIDSEITAETQTIKFTPMENFTLEAKDDFWLLISAVQGRSSLYLKDPDEIPKYPWLTVRTFDHKPSLNFNINHTPENIQTSFLKYYNKKYKKGLNSNLSTFNLVFDKRSDQEAAEILQFLESHLGYKKFRFQMPRPYLKDVSATTSPSRSFISTFYCPSWGHDIVYKNNHSITATFIESTTSTEENLLNVFGVGRKEEKPCYGAELFDPVTKFELCTFSSILQATNGIGFEVVEGQSEQLIGKPKAVDLVFIVDTTGSMTNQSMEINGVTKTKYQVCIDVILKMITAHDSYIMPGTESYNGEFNTPALSFGSNSGDNTIPPWPADNAVLNSLLPKLYDPLKELRDSLENEGYNLENLDRFKIKIDQKRVNLGFVLMADPRQVIQDVSDLPNSFDKIQSYKKIDVKDPGWQLLEDSPRAVSQALAQFYNSPRAEHVTDRIIIMLSDGVFTSPDATMPGNNYNQFYSQYTLDMCAQLRKGGELAKRRPADSVLKKYGYQSQTPYEKLESYKYKEKDDGGSYYNNPDLGKENPIWYEEEMPTVFMFARVGIPGQLSTYAPNYVYDYDKPAPYLEPPSKTPQFFFPITQEGDLSGEVTRMIDLIKVVEMLANDNGYQNVFSIILYNCGPHDVRLKNTLVNIKSQAEPLKYTTEILKEGIPKGGKVSELRFTQPNQSKESITQGYGGQYYGDLDNQDLFSDESKDSNILWASFNTKYEVSREGVIENINGGWAENSTLSEGVKNVGVAFKGMPIRVFKADSGLEITDYNIGNVNAENQYRGDYSHLPVIKPGEKLDLFFGIKTNKLSDFSESVQLLVNSDDGTTREMECYGNYEFDILIPASKESLKSEPLEIVPEKEEIAGYGIHMSNLPLGGSNDGKSIEQQQAEFIRLVLTEGSVHPDSTTRSYIPVFDTSFFPEYSFLTSSSITDGSNIKKMFTGTDVIKRQPFYQEVRSLCAKKSVTIEVFSGANFSGNILFQKTGPFLLYHKTSLRPLLDDYLMGFGISEVDIISVDMNGWLNGSIRIT